MSRRIAYWYLLKYRNQYLGAGWTNSIPAREIKRRGIVAVDEALKEGPVHVIEHDKPAYVVLTEDHYRELVDGYEEYFVAGVNEALADLKVGRVRRVTAQPVIDEFGLAGCCSS